MKKISLLVLSLILLSLILSKCEQTELPEYDWPESNPTTFEEITASYLEEYGLPESTSEFITSDYHAIDWWWWSKGFMVCFETSLSGAESWYVVHTYSF